MGKRREPRKPVQVTVRILGTDADGRPFAEKVETLDVSRSGVHLCGLSVALKLEDTVSVSYKNQKARYLVKWLVPVPAVPGSPARWNAGLENRAPERDIFDFPLPTPILDNYVGQSSSGMPGGSAADRRTLPRMRCVASAELHPAGSSAPIMAGIADLSLGGCFVDMPMTLPIGTQLKAVVWLDAVKLQVSAVVSNIRPGFGMGLRFTALPPEENAKLEAYLAKTPRYPFQKPR
jgi:hypothetical protein